MVGTSLIYRPKKVTYVVQELWVGELTTQAVV